MIVFVHVLLANLAAFVGLHLLLVLGKKLNLPHFFVPHRWPFRAQRWERRGRIYQKLFFVHRWKGFIPELPPLTRSFSKRRMLSLTPIYLDRFQLEICRGELMHWVGLMFLPLFLIWNPPWARVLMTFVFLFGHIPCILIQRYNRPRFLNLISGLSKRSRGERRGFAGERVGCKVPAAKSPAK